MQKPKEETTQYVFSFNKDKYLNTFYTFEDTILYVLKRFLFHKTASGQPAAKIKL